MRWPISEPTLTTGLTASPRVCATASMRSGGRVWYLAASVVRLEPTVEHSDSIIETVGGADRDESLTAADRALAPKGLERGEREVRLGKRQPGLGTQPGVPARCCSLEPPRLLVE